MVATMHSDLTQVQRDKTVFSFREGKIWVLICTDLMARGIDFKGVNLVINYDFPNSTISYIHKIGRAGRAGRKGKAITFFTIEDYPNLRSIAVIVAQSGHSVPEYMLKMKKIPKRELKKMKYSAPHRENIKTGPRLDVLKKSRTERLSKYVQKSDNTEGKIVVTNDVNIYNGRS